MTASRLLFEVWPYVALAVFAGGLAGRLAQLGRRAPPSPYELARVRAEFAGGRLWRLGAVVLVAGHVLGLAFPAAVRAWSAAPGRLYVLEGLGLAAGAATVWGCARLVARYLERPARGALAEIADSAFFSLLFVALSSGVVTALAYRWGSSWSAATLAPYTASLLRGAPSAALVERLPFLAQVHVVASLAALAVSPFSRLAVLPAAVLHRAAAVVSAAGAAEAIRVAAWWRRRDRLAWLWPDEEVRWLDGTPDAEGAARAPEARRARPARRDVDVDVDGRMYESGS